MKRSKDHEWDFKNDKIKHNAYTWKYLKGRILISLCIIPSNTTKELGCLMHALLNVIKAMQLSLLGYTLYF